jgi:hypothetical protein
LKKITMIIILSWATLVWGSYSTESPNDCINKCSRQYGKSIKQCTKIFKTSSGLKLDYIERFVCVDTTKEEFHNCIIKCESNAR